MGRWTCPDCEREFAVPRQAHACAPGCTVDASFAGRPPVQREIYDAVLAHVRSLGPVHEDAVRVGVFLKVDRKMAELRPGPRSLALLIFLPRRLEHPRVSRHLRVSAERTLHVVRFTSPDDLDDDVRAWLTEAYAAAAP